MRAVFDIERLWNARVATPDLNRWLAEITDRHPPPLVSGRRIRLRYMTQVNIRPPTFALWISKPADLPQSYLRYLVNGLRDAFGLEGVPIRLMMRKGKNPYEQK
jgi:GTP-binding protein